jgi:outer membrane receptor protein involved in Fe transport
MRKEFILFYFLFFSSFAFAITPTYKLIPGEEIVVTATRIKSKKRDIPGVIDVITKEDIKKTKATTITELLKKNIGLDVIEYPSILSGVNLRGFRPELPSPIKHLSLLVDSRRAGVSNLSTILLDDIEKVEILKGPASSLYGAEAMAGVINIITKKSKEKIEGKVEIEDSSFDSWKRSLSVGGALITKKLDFDLYLTEIRKGNYEVPKYKVGNFKWEGGVWKGNNYKIYNHITRIGYLFNKNHSLNVRGDVFWGDEINSAGDIYGNYGLGKNEIKRNSFDLSYEGKIKKHQWLAKLFFAKEKSLDYSNKDYSYWPPKDVPWYKSFLNCTEYLGSQLQDTISLPLNNQLTFGVDYNHDKSISEAYHPDGRRKSPYYLDDEKINWGFFCENKSSFFQEKITTLLGGRYDFYTLKTLDTPYFAFTPYKAGEEELSSFNPRGGIVFKPNKAARFHFSLGSAFVVPKPYEKTGYYTSWGTLYRGNPKLKPEKSLSYDLGCEFNLFPLNFELSYFHTDLKDKISSKKMTATEVTYENIGKAEMSGIENTLSLHLGELFHIKSDLRLYSYLTYLIKARDITNKKDLENVAKVKLNSGIEFDHRRLSGRINFRYVGEMKEENWYRFYRGRGGDPYLEDKIEYGDFTVTDLNLSYRINKNLTVNCKIENLFNRFYEEKPGYPMPARNVSTGVIIKF